MKYLQADKKLVLQKEDWYGKSFKEPWFFFPKPFKYPVYKHISKGWNIPKSIYLKAAWKYAVGYLPYVAEVCEYLEKQQPSIIIFQKPNPLTFVPALVHKRKHPDCKIVFDCDEWDPGTLKDNRASSLRVRQTELLSNLAIKNADAIICANELIIKEKIPSNFRKKCVYIPNGVDTKKYRSEKIPHKEFRLIFSGTLFIIEELLPLLEIAENLKEKIKNLKLFVVGIGPAEEKFREKIREKKLEKYFVFVRYPSEKEFTKLISSCDVAIMPFSDLEGIRYQSKVRLFIYMAMGIPVVASDVGEIKKILNSAGYTIEPGNIDAFSNAVYAIYKNPEEAKSKTTKARKIAEQKYDWRVLSKKLAAALGV
jgi:glycosyltransferase involved in cell wall biosynthesis